MQGGSEGVREGESEDPVCATVCCLFAWKTGARVSVENGKREEKRCVCGASAGRSAWRWWW